MWFLKNHDFIHVNSTVAGQYNQYKQDDGHLRFPIRTIFGQMSIYLPSLMQRFSPKASSVLEKIFKGFYHIWAWRPTWSTSRDHLSNLSFPQPKEAPYEIWAKLAQRLQMRGRLKFCTFFPYKCIRKQNWPYRKKVKCQCTTIILATLVDFLFLMIYVKVQP